jgi:hypothetical protein
MMAAAAEERSREQWEAKSKKQGKDGKDVAK